jgi:hypothetical protein
MKIKQLILTTITVCSLLTTTLQASPNATANRIVAVVNNQVITQYELNRATNLAENIYNQTPKNTDFPIDWEKQKKTILQNLVKQQVQVQDANNRGASVTNENAEKLLKSAAARFKQAQGGDLLKLLTKSGFSHENMLNYERNNMLAMLGPREIFQKTPIPKHEIEAVIDANTTISANDYVSQSEKEANTIATQLRENKTPQPQRPSDVFKEKKLSDMPDLLKPALRNKKTKGDVVGPIDTGKGGNGWHVLQITQYQQNTSDISQNLLQIKAKLAQPAIKKWQDDLKKNAYTEIRAPYKNA